MKRRVAVPLLLAMLNAACGRVPAVARWYTRADERVLWHARTSAKVVALTIDDGPSAETDSILDVLARHRAKATFFVIGSHVQGREAVVRRMVREGHELGNPMLFDVPSAPHRITQLPAADCVAARR